MDLSEVDIHLPMLVYVTREKRPGYDHNKKAWAMNALVRRFEGIDPSDRYANHNTVFFDVNMLALDRIQEETDCCSCCFPRLKKPVTVASAPDVDPEDIKLRKDDEMNIALIPKKF
ncbi:hypothetical protein REPUB_Repub08aG0040100 [Reevesia pubescens]